ncbi:hypothetical protein [Actinokineospora bangkokensis]|nr:hypothetical protein [Actinokineospora bangkokensis]
MTGHDIYVAMTSGPGVSSLADGYSAADVEARKEAERAERIRLLANRTAAGWQGEAGDAAYGGAGPIADATRLGAANLEQTHTLLQDQVQEFSASKARLEPIPAAPPETGFLDDLTPWDTDTEDQVNQYNQSSQQNIMVYAAYDNSSQANSYELPTDYSNLVDPGGEISVTPPPGGTENPGVNPPGGRSEVSVPGGTQSTYSQSYVQQQTAPSHYVQPQGGTGGPVTTGPGGSNPNQTTPSWAGTTPVGGGGTRPPYYNPNGPYNPGSQWGQNGAAGPFGPGRPFGGGGTGSGTGGGAGGAGARGGFGPGGSGVGGGAGTGGGAGAGAGEGAHGGPRPGAGAGAGAGEHGASGRGGLLGGAAAEEGRTTGGRGGQAGAGMGAGGGRGQGGEDEEHERASFLIEDDPEAVFGTDEMTAPPVIGG